MTRQSKAYARYGSFILFRKLEESSLAEIWRAGRIDGNAVEETVTLLRFTGGDTAALKRAAERAAPALPALRGSTVVKGQTYLLVGRNPIITWEYTGGRSLHHVMKTARGGVEAPANPIPIDQALAIAEKLAMSLETTGQIKHGGQRLQHGSLIPQFVWISEDGDVRTLGHQLTPGIISSMKRPSVQTEFGGYLAPETGRNGVPTGPSEVWSVGAMLYAMLTDRVVPPPTDQNAIDTLLDDAVLGIEEPIPPQVLEVVRKSLAIDPGRRYESPAALREDLGRLTRGGDYAPTTFNLAFYIHNLLGEEIEREAAEREEEKGVDPALVPPLGGAVPAEAEETGGAGVAAAASEPTPPASAAVPPPPERSRGRAPIVAAAAVLLLLALGAAGYWFTVGPGSGRTAQPDETVAAVARAEPEVRPELPILEPLIATDTGEGGLEITDEPTGEQPLSDEQLRQRMIQDEIERRLQEEIMKLQADYDRRLREERAREQARTQPTRTTTQPPAATPTPPVETAQRTPPPAERPASEPPPREPAATVTETTATASPPAAQPPAAREPATPPAAQQQTPPPPPVPQTRQGDLVEFSEVDQPPRFQRRVEPDYPPMAARQKAEATIFLSVLVSETGSVLDVRVLRGDQRRLGFEEAAEAAIRRSTFHPAIKNGQRVRTWMPVPIIFKAR
jgi:periplasmic protein TonB